MSGRKVLNKPTRSLITEFGCGILRVTHLSKSRVSLNMSHPGWDTEVLGSLKIENLNHKLYFLIVA